MTMLRALKFAPVTSPAALVSERLPPPTARLAGVGLAISHLGSSVVPANLWPCGQPPPAPPQSSPRVCGLLEPTTTLNASMSTTSLAPSSCLANRPTRKPPGAPRYCETLIAGPKDANVVPSVDVHVV